MNVACGAKIVCERLKRVYYFGTSVLAIPVIGPSNVFERLDVNVNCDSQLDVLTDCLFSM